jgi:O-antigen/teichoic acid export membrane protein
MDITKSSTVKPNLSRGALWTFGGQGIAALLAVLNFAVVGRFVSPSEYGSYLLALVVLSATQWLALNAYREPLVQTKNISDNIINSVFGFSLAVGALLFGVMLVASFFYPAGTKVCIVLLGAKLVADTLVAVPTALKSRHLNFRLLSIISVTVGITGSALNILMLFAGFGIFSLAASQMIASLVSLVIHLYTGDHRYRLRLKKEDLSLLVRYSPHVILWQAIEAVNQTIDRALIISKLDTVSLGFYGFGKRLNDTVIDLLVGTASTVSFPAFSRLQDQSEQLRETFLKAVRIVTMGVMPVIAVLHVTAGDLIPLVFGHKWESSTVVYRWFLMLGIIQTIGILQGALIKSMSRPGIWSTYTAVQACANVVVVIFTVKYGIAVLAASIVLRTYAIWGWAMFTTCRLLGVSILFYAKESLSPILIAALGAACGYYALSLLGGAAPLLRLVVGTVVTLLMYFVISSIFMRKGLLEMKNILMKIVSKAG